MSGHNVEVGQQYREVGKTFLWEIEAIIERPGEPVHVRLHMVDDIYRLKTVGVSALVDKTLFERADARRKL
ncbi:MAG: hypothetical protein AAF220_08445 [Pseudomonadota bacterium]